MVREVPWATTHAAEVVQVPVGAFQVPAFITQRPLPSVPLTLKPEAKASGAIPAIEVNPRSASSAIAAGLNRDLLEFPIVVGEFIFVLAKLWTHNMSRFL